MKPKAPNHKSEDVCPGRVYDMVSKPPDLEMAGSSRSKACWKVVLSATTQGF